jgi:hypothetical protein
MFFNVSFYRKEVFADELGSFLIFIRLGIQPSAGSSRRGRAEIEQDGAGLLLCCGQALIDILTPIHAHHSPPGRFSRTDFSSTASWT